jgi:hypothetical protein
VLVVVGSFDVLLLLLLLLLFRLDGSGDGDDVGSKTMKRIPDLSET